MISDYEIQADRRRDVLAQIVREHFSHEDFDDISIVTSLDEDRPMYRYEIRLRDVPQLRLAMNRWDSVIRDFEDLRPHARLNRPMHPDHPFWRAR